jgi:hypothetical protein
VRYELMVDARGPEGIAAVERSLEGLDLTVTLAAQAAAVDVLHFDQHLERLGENLGIGSHWISDPRDGPR